MEDNNLYIINVGKHTYEAAEEYVTNCINMAKESVGRFSDMAIVGIEKDKTIVMMNEIHFDKQKYHESIRQYESEGFKVHTIKEVE